ncbi:MAG: manganese efflux pump MntP family protein [Phycisphaerae bacterium]|nr:manganese efflux pump MntP family protein [Phycisphaerae bacterium]
MSFLTILFIAVGLAMDAFAVSVATGVLQKKTVSRDAWRLAFAFGVFQAIMPLAGFFLGMGLKTFIASYDHWVAFTLLMVIGIKMIYESFKIEQTERKAIVTNTTLLVLAIATSIDALAVGFTFSMLLASSILYAVVIIGVVTFILSFIGYHVGKNFGRFFEFGIEAVGGLILIAIAVKILTQHLIA